MAPCPGAGRTHTHHVSKMRIEEEARVAPSVHLFLGIGRAVALAPQNDHSPRLRAETGQAHGLKRPRRWRDPRHVGVAGAAGSEHGACAWAAGVAARARRWGACRFVLFSPCGSAPRPPLRRAAPRGRASPAGNQAGVDDGRGDASSNRRDVTSNPRARRR